MKGIEKVTAWVTKYALTEGVQKVKGEVNHDISSNMLCYGRGHTAHGKDWHRTSEAALTRAEEMREAKIKSLNKSLNKVKGLIFWVS